jgi:hypothetical protein
MREWMSMAGEEGMLRCCPNGGERLVEVEIGEREGERGRGRKSRAR